MVPSFTEIAGAEPLVKTAYSLLPGNLLDHIQIETSDLLAVERVAFAWSAVDYNLVFTTQIGFVTAPVTIPTSAAALK